MPTRRRPSTRHATRRTARTTTRTTPPATSLHALDTFKRWLREQGVVLHGVTVRHDPRPTSAHERGVFATRRIPAGTLVVKVPRHALFHHGAGETTRTGARLLRTPEAYRALAAPKLALLVLAMAQQLHTRDPTFAPYHALLPTHAQVKHFPVFWSDARLRRHTPRGVDARTFADTVNARKRTFDNDYDTLCGVDDQFGETCSRAMFWWLRTLAGSRNFGVDIDGTHRSAMVPFADMLNHAHPADVSWGFDAAHDAFCMRATRDIACGAPVTDSYGVKAPERMLLYYGFGG